MPIRASTLQHIRAIVRYLLRESVFGPKIPFWTSGAAPAPFRCFLPTGQDAVVGLDISEDMLSAMMGTAKASGTDNIRPICSSWEKYGGKKKFDLVFSSFCPAINDADTLLRMEERSRRSCCYVTSGDIAPGILADSLWELITGKCIERTPSDALYLFNILYFSGRSPSLRFFKYDYNIAVPAARLTGQFIAYFEMYMELDRHTVGMINDHVYSHSIDGVYRKSARDTVCAIHWDV